MECFKSLHILTTNEGTALKNPNDCTMRTFSVRNDTIPVFYSGKTFLKTVDIIYEKWTDHCGNDDRNHAK